MPPRAPYCSAALLSRDKNSSGKWLPLSRWPEGGFIRSAALRRSDHHIRFAVDDIEAEVKTLKTNGFETRNENFHSRKLVFVSGWRA